MVLGVKIIPISKPSVGDEEINAIKRVLKTGLLTYGKEVRKFEEEFSTYVGTKFGVATNNGTSALHTALASLGIKEGDEVITTSFSFISTATCILMQGAKPSFCDIDPRTYNIDPEQIKEKISEKTKAIIAVHLFGQPCEMKPILEIAEDHGIPVVEDACQAHGAEYHGRKVGSLGDVGCFSFYPTKNMTTGEGGMLTTDDEEIAEKARMFVDHGQRGRHYHESLGYNYRMTNISAALGRIQLKKLDDFNGRRIENAKFYNENLEGVQKPHVAKDVKHVFHQYSLRVKDRYRFIKHLEKNDVGYGIYYPTPIHKQPLFERWGVSLPNAEVVSRDIISIPVHQSLNRDELRKVVEVVNSYE